MDIKNRTELENVFFLPGELINKLAQYRIHYVEHLLSLVQDEKNTRTMATTLGITLEDMELIKKLLQASYPNIKVPQRSNRSYPLGAMDPKTKFLKSKGEKK